MVGVGGGGGADGCCWASAAAEKPDTLEILMTGCPALKTERIMPEKCEKFINAAWKTAIAARNVIGMW